MGTKDTLAHSTEAVWADFTFIPSPLTRNRCCINHSDITSFKLPLWSSWKDRQLECMYAEMYGIISPLQRTTPGLSWMGVRWRPTLQEQHWMPSRDTRRGFTPWSSSTWRARTSRRTSTLWRVENWLDHTSSCPQAGFEVPTWIFWQRFSKIWSNWRMWQVLEHQGKVNGVCRFAHLSIWLFITILVGSVINLVSWYKIFLVLTTIIFPPLFNASGIFYYLCAFLLKFLSIF